MSAVQCTPSALESQLNDPSRVEISMQPDGIPIRTGQEYSELSPVRQKIASALKFDDLSIILPQEKVEEISRFIFSHLNEMAEKVEIEGKAKCIVPCIPGCVYKVRYAEPLIVDSDGRLVLVQPIESYIRIHVTKTLSKNIEMLVYLTPHDAEQTHPKMRTLSSPPEKKSLPPGFTGESTKVFLYAKPNRKAPDGSTNLYTAFKECMEAEGAVSRCFDSPYVLKIENIMKRAARYDFKANRAPWCLNGDLLSYLWEQDRHLCQRSGPPPFHLFQERLRIGWQIAEGLEHIHRCGYTHLDLKLENIGLQPTPSGLNAIIFDFGSVRPSGYVIEFPITTRQYTPPEAWQQFRAVSPADDCWALGLLLLELISFRANNLFLHPRLHKTTEEDYNNPTRYEFVQKEWESIRQKILAMLVTLNDDRIMQLIIRLLNLNPFDRPTAGEAKTIVKELHESHYYPV